jgi:hypothetical protein
MPLILILVFLNKIERIISDTCCANILHEIVLTRSSTSKDIEHVLMFIVNNRNFDQNIRRHGRIWSCCLLHM